jgi:DNA-binding transcriptional ArsR family regulator
MMGYVNTTALVIDAFAQLGIEARQPAGAPDHGVDLVVDPDGIGVEIQVKHRSLVNQDTVERLLSDDLPPDASLLVVADRVTDAARKRLTARRCGYLDLRGRLALRTDQLVIDAEVEPVVERAERARALSGKVGLEVATALLLQPERAVAVRELSRELGRSPSTVSEVLAALRRDELIDTHHAVTDSRLFWQVADHWPTPRTPVAKLPALDDASLTQPLRLGLDDVDKPGWALTDSAAAAAYGAPLAFRPGQILDFYVPDLSVVRRAATLLGTAPTLSQAPATVRVAPVPAVVHRRVDLDTNLVEWPLAHPLFVALDLAQDVGRGREVLDHWTPATKWPRVW